MREEVESAQGEVAAAQKRLEEVYAAYSEPDADIEKLAEEQARLEAIIENAGADTGNALEIAADALRLPPWDARVRHLSGGEKRRVALCKLLLSKPDMLLLDEPTNHLDAESVEWLEQFLTRFPGTVVAITHDRYFLDNAAEWILELDRGRGIPWKGNYSLVARAEGAAARGRGQAGERPHQGHEAGARVGAPEPQGAARRRARRASRASRSSPRSSTRSATRPRRSSSRWPSGSATR